MILRIAEAAISKKAMSVNESPMLRERIRRIEVTDEFAPDSAAASWAASSAACCDSRIASTTADFASSTASRTASLSAPGGNLISTPMSPSEIPVAAEALLAAGAAAPSEAADAEEAAEEALAPALAAAGLRLRGVIRTPSLSIEIVTARPPESFFSILTTGSFLPGLGGVGALGGFGVRLGVIVTSSELPMGRLNGGSLERMTELISSRIESSRKRIHVMPTSQLP